MYQRLLAVAFALACASAAADTGTPSSDSGGVRVDGNTIVILAVAIAVIGVVFGTTKKVANAEMTIKQSAAEVAKIQPLQDRVLILENEHKSANAASSTALVNHIASDDRVLSELKSGMEAIRVTQDEIREELVGMRMELKLAKREGLRARDPKTS